MLVVIDRKKEFAATRVGTGRVVFGDTHYYFLSPELHQYQHPTNKLPIPFLFSLRILFDFGPQYYTYTVGFLTFPPSKSFIEPRKMADRRESLLNLLLSSSIQ